MIIRNNIKFYTHEEVMDRIYNTPAKRRKFEKFHKKYSAQLKLEALKELGNEIKQARKRSGVSQGELAKRLKTSRPAISRIEKGDQNLTVEYIVKVAVALERPYEVRIY